MSRKGTVRFDDSGLFIQGYLTPSPLFQFGIVLVLTIIPLVVFGIGLGFIPALIVAYYVGRKQIADTIPYVQIRDLSATGCKLTFATAGGLPGKVSFYVAASDGERLYRELQGHPLWFAAPR